MKVIDFLLFTLLILLFIFGATLLVNNLDLVPKETLEYEAYISNLTVDAKAANVAQFYPNMRYQNSTITYTIEDTCSPSKIEDIRAALDIIGGNSIVDFKELSSGGEIKYLCSNVAPASDQKDHFVAGEGGPTGIINTTLFSVITSGQVSLYRSERCNKPQIALHETLHALGFDHVKNPKDIMYPVTECNQETSEALFKALDELYSIRTSPDLGIEYVKANQTGRYLNFFITIVNYGLRDTNDASLILYADDKQIREFPLGPITLGTKKFLNVQNMRLESEVDVVKFVLKMKDDDLYEDNNFAEIYLQYK
jgi:hypothetical protein